MKHICIFLLILRSIKYIIFFFRYADQVSVGDEVLVEGNEQLIPAEVINVLTLAIQGNNI